MGSRHKRLNTHCVIYVQEILGQAGDLQDSRRATGPGPRVTGKCLPLPGRAHNARTCSVGSSSLTSTIIKQRPSTVQHFIFLYFQRIPSIPFFLKTLSLFIFICFCFILFLTDSFSCILPFSLNSSCPLPLKYA